MIVDDWLKRNKERQEQLQEMRQLKLELEYERTLIANSEKEEHSSLHLVYASTALLAGVVIGLLASKRLL